MQKSHLFTWCLVFPTNIYFFFHGSNHYGRSQNICLLTFFENHHTITIMRPLQNGTQFSSDSPKSRISTPLRTLSPQTAIRPQMTTTLSAPTPLQKHTCASTHERTHTATTRLYNAPLAEQQRTQTWLEFSQRTRWRSREIQCRYQMCLCCQNCSGPCTHTGMVPSAGGVRENKMGEGDRCQNWHFFQNSYLTCQIIPLSLGWFRSRSFQLPSTCEFFILRLVFTQKVTWWWHIRQVT